MVVKEGFLENMKPKLTRQEGKETVLERTEHVQRFRAIKKL